VKILFSGVTFVQLTESRRLRWNLISGHGMELAVLGHWTKKKAGAF
jgi:hypothetical protein